MSAAIVRLASPPHEPDGDDRGLLRKMEARERLKRRLDTLDAEIAQGCRAWSFARGFRVPLRPEQVRREIESTREDVGRG